MKRFSIIVITSLILILLSVCGENNKGKAINLNEVINNQKENAITGVSDEILKANIYVKINHVVLFFQDIYISNKEKDKCSLSIFEDDTKESYVGEYNSYDVDALNLKIQKKANGTYKIQIGICNTFFYDCIGAQTKNGIIFLAKWGDRVYRGIIIFEDDIITEDYIATVTFTSLNWEDFSRINQYKYYKISDIPNIYELP